MSNVPESASYDAGIYQLETVDEVLGGVNGKANAQAKGLANRTNWLKSQVDALNLLKGKGVASFSIANSYVAGEIVDYQKNIYRANTTVVPGAWNASQWNKLLGAAAESELASVAPLMNGSAAVGTSTLLARQDHVHPADTGREAAIAAGTTAQFWRGDKTWQDFAAAVRGSALTGLSTVTSTVVAAADTILVAIGKLQAQITLRAPLDDPTFTGVPAAPTPANGTNTTQLATTAFVQSQIASSVPAASEIVAGKVELATAAETTTGTDNTRAVHPAGLKVELDKKAPLASPVLTGAPAAPTPAQFDNDTSLATTAFVQRALGNFRDDCAFLSVDTTLAATDAGKPYIITDAAAIITLPTLASAVPGTAFSFLTDKLVTLKGSGSEQINHGAGQGNTYGAFAGESFTVVAGASAWYMVGHGYGAGSFAANVAASGYQKLPTGLIIQWGTVASVAGNGNATVTYPLAFPFGCFSVVAIAGAANIGLPALSGINASISNKTGFVAYNTSASVATQPGLYIAIGY